MIKQKLISPEQEIAQSPLPSEVKSDWKGSYFDYDAGEKRALDEYLERRKLARAKNPQK